MRPTDRDDSAPDPLITAITDGGNAQPVGKLEAHKKGLLHQALSVFVFSGAELLLQRRAAGKYHSGLLWANSCCSHPLWQEPVGKAAARRLQQELGIDVPLMPAGVLEYRADVGGGMIEHERVQAFVGRADRTTLCLAPDPAEVAEIRWVGLSDLRREATDTPAAFAPWLRIYLARWDELQIG